MSVEKGASQSYIGDIVGGWPLILVAIFFGLFVEPPDSLTPPTPLPGELKKTRNLSGAIATKYPRLKPAIIIRTTNKRNKKH